MSGTEEKLAHDAGRGLSRLSRFARLLMKEWRRLALPAGGARFVVAVSGGADSVALLLALDELSRAGRLKVDLTVAHLDHGLRGEAGREDALWVKDLAEGLGFEVETGEARVKERAASVGDNLEQAARRARYEFLAGVSARVGARAVLTAHTLDDQAETVLLRLMRGSGAEGLGGIEPVRALGLGGETQLVRPLLRWARRAETEQYCARRNVRFRADEMNEDESFARVRVRRKLLPLMATFNGRVVEALARTAELLREDAAALGSAAENLLKEAGVEEASAGKLLERGAGLGASAEDDTPPAPCALRVGVLREAGVAVRRRALRLWIARGRGDLRRMEMAHLLAVERLIEGERGGRVAELPGGALVERRRGLLRLRLKKVEKGGAGV